MWWFWPWLAFLPFASREMTVLPLTSDHARALSRLHAEDFRRPWTDGEFVDLMKQETVFGFGAFPEGAGAGDPEGFVLARLAAGDDLSTAVRWASAGGALATTIEGAVPSLPRRAAVRTLLDAH